MEKPLSTFAKLLLIGAGAGLRILYLVPNTHRRTHYGNLSRIN